MYAPHTPTRPPASSPLATALRDYLDRRDGRTRPAGSRDSKSRWTPSADERRDCCSTIRRPSAAYPFSLLDHCRSAEHVAALHGVDASKLRGAARSVRAMLRVDPALALELLIASTHTPVRERALAQMRSQDWALLTYEDLTPWLTDVKVPPVLRERAFALLHRVRRPTQAAA